MFHPATKEEIDFLTSETKRFITIAEVAMGINVGDIGYISLVRNSDYVGAVKIKMGEGSYDIGFSYNLTWFRFCPEIFAKQVIPHEVAHFVAYYLFEDDSLKDARKHGPVWKMIMTVMGEDPSPVAKIPLMTVLKKTFLVSKRRVQRIKALHLWGYKHRMIV